VGGTIVYTASAPLKALIRKGTSDTDPMAAFAPIDPIASTLLASLEITVISHDGTQAAKDKVLANYCAEPAIPFGNTVTLTSENFGAVPKVYIKTLQDIVISPVLQDRMIAAAGVKLTYSLNTSHSPFLSQPNAVSDLLLEIAQEYNIMSQVK
jgi:pimeloyl-ACP methyl ester carboxylesterase